MQSLLVVNTAKRTETQLAIGPTTGPRLNLRFGKPGGSSTWRPRMIKTTIGMAYEMFRKTTELESYCQRSAEGLKQRIAQLTIAFKAEELPT